MNMGKKPVINKTDLSRAELKAVTALELAGEIALQPIYGKDLRVEIEIDEACRHYRVKIRSPSSFFAQFTSFDSFTPKIMVKWLPVNGLAKATGHKGDAATALDGQPNLIETYSQQLIDLVETMANNREHVFAVKAGTIKNIKSEAISSLHNLEFGALTGSKGNCCWVFSYDAYDGDLVMRKHIDHRWVENETDTVMKILAAINGNYRQNEQMAKRGEKIVADTPLSHLLRAASIDLADFIAMPNVQRMLSGWTSSNAQTIEFVAGGHCHQYVISVVAKKGVITSNFKLSDDVKWANGQVLYYNSNLPETIVEDISQSKGKNVRDIIDHPWLDGLAIKKTWRQKTKNAPINIMTVPMAA